MADEKNEDPTSGSDPSSPHEPDPAAPEGAEAGPEAPRDASDEGPQDAAEQELTADHGSESPQDVDDPEQDGRDETADEPALVGAAGASRRPVRREQGEQTSEKGRATRRRGGDEADSRSERTGPVTFVNESVGELRKVVWPTSEMMRTYFVVVLVFVVFMITVVSLLDLLFGWALLQVFR